DYPRAADAGAQRPRATSRRRGQSPGAFLCGLRNTPAKIGMVMACLSAKLMVGWLQLGAGGVSPRQRMRRDMARCPEQARDLSGGGTVFRPRSFARRASRRDAPFFL